MIELSNVGPELTDADIERVEAKLGIRFPDDYRGYIKVANSFTEFLSLLGPYDEISRDW